jgi:hypothetical protein
MASGARWNWGRRGSAIFAGRTDKFRLLKFIGLNRRPHRAGAWLRRGELKSPREQAQRYGDETKVIDWKERLVCSKCGRQEVDMVVTGSKR